MQRATLGFRPSFLWRSLLYGKRVIDEGARWRVGDGRDIQIWNDFWVPGLTQKRLYWPNVSERPGTCLSILIDDSGHKWKEELLMELFSEEEVDAIKKIPLTRYNLRDCLIWTGSPTGTFSVRSAYYFAGKIMGEEMDQISLRTQVWKSIWLASVQPKIHNFLWRLFMNILPTSYALSTRGVPVIHGCSVCGETLENAAHIMFQCELSKRAWEELSTDLAKSIEDNLAEEDFLWQWCKRAEELKLKEDAFYLAWIIWKNRNVAKHEGRCEMASILVQKARRYRQEYYTAMSTNSHGATTTSNEEVRWIRPMNGWVKINVDMGMNQSGTGCLGVVARDHNGMVLFSGAVGVASIDEVVQGELLAIHYGLELAKEAQLTKVVMESDSLMSIKEIGKQQFTLSPWGSLLMDILGLSLEFTNVNFKYVPRAANSIAHNLAKLNLEPGENRFWRKHLPCFIVNNDLVQ